MARQMKNSGVEWIGNIPNDWKIRRNKTLFDCSKEIVGTASKETQLLSLTTQGVKTKSQDAIGGKVPESFDTYQTVTPDDIVMCLFDLDCSAVFSGISPYYGMISPAYKILKCKSAVLPKYADYWFRFIFDGRKFKSYAKNLRYTLNYDEFAVLPFALPNIGEQEKIVSHLDKICSDIDVVVSKTKATIEEYKKLKQSIITEAVTKGIRGDRPMKDSGIEWIGDIPADWDIRVAFQLFQQVKNKNEGLVEQNLLSLSYGKIKRRNIDAVGGLLPESFDGYNIIEKDDIVLRLTDLQNDQTSLRVGLSTERGIVTSAYLTLRNQSANTPLYLYYYLHTFDVCKGFYGMGAGVRQGLNWDGLKLLKFALPSVDEQIEITEYLQKKCAEMDTLIDKKTALLEEMETYKKSVIYEYVTGKKEVASESTQTVTVIYPYFPSVIATNKPRFAQAVLMSKILDSNVSNMGRVKLEKMLFTIEHSLGFDFDTEYSREAAGPLDSSIYECERVISRANKWFYVNSSKYGVSYKPQRDMGKYKKYYEQYFSEYNEEIERIINVFRNYSLDQAEIVATLYGAWNDFIIDNKAFTDEDIVNDVLNNWNDSKKRFSKDVWLRAIESMRNNNLVPQGYGKHTVTNPNS